VQAIYHAFIIRSLHKNSHFCLVSLGNCWMGGCLGPNVSLHLVCISEIKPSPGLPHGQLLYWLSFAWPLTRERSIIGCPLTSRIHKRNAFPPCAKDKNKWRNTPTAPICLRGFYKDNVALYSEINASIISQKMFRSTMTKINVYQCCWCWNAIPLVSFDVIRQDCDVM
jgi:hypothetical protein